MEPSPGLARFSEVVARDDFTLDHAALLIGAWDYPERDLTEALRRLNEETSVLASPYYSFSVNIEPRAEVFYNCDLLTRRWGRFASLVSVTREAMDYQTALLFRK